MTRAEAIEWLEIATPIRELSTKDYKRFMKAITMAIDSLETDEAYQLEYERTTKNDLGVDAVSRQTVIDLMIQKWGENFSGDSAMQESIDAIRVLPSVTPQEPKILDTIDFAIDASNGDTNYFVGFRNGLRYAKSLIDGEEPQFESCTEQEPFINKPCVSSGVCEHDKNKVLDKIYADIQKLRGCSCSCSDGIIDDVEDIIDKYTNASENSGQYDTFTKEQTDGENYD